MSWKDINTKPETRIYWTHTVHGYVTYTDGCPHDSHGTFDASLSRDESLALFSTFTPQSNRHNLTQYESVHFYGDYCPLKISTDPSQKKPTLTRHCFTKLPCLKLSELCLVSSWQSHKPISVCCLSINKTSKQCYLSELIKKMQFSFWNNSFHLQFSFQNIWHHYDIRSLSILGPVQWNWCDQGLLTIRWSREAVTTNLVCITFTEITVSRFPPWFAGLKSFFHASPKQQDTFSRSLLQ